MLNTITQKAEIKNLNKVIDAIGQDLKELGCNSKDNNAICLCLEEVFTNVVNYAYPEEVGMVTIKYGFDEIKKQFILIFIDNGVKFNPLTKKDPNVGLAAERREIGGLGIFLCKRLMDHMEYCYKDNQNILIIKKNITN